MYIVRSSRTDALWWWIWRLFSRSRWKVITIWATIGPDWWYCHIELNAAHCASCLSLPISDWSRSYITIREHDWTRHAAILNDEMQSYTIITNDSNWKLILLIVKMFFESQKMFYDFNDKHGCHDRPQDLERFDTITTIKTAISGVANCDTCSVHQSLKC